MQTKISVEKTYWIGMTPDQLTELTTAMVAIFSNEESLKLFISIGGVTKESVEVLDDLRQALLNV